MPSFENLKVLMVLLPGFLSQRISHYFGTQYKRSDIDTIVSALVFTLLNAAIAALFCRIFKIDLQRNEKLTNSFVIIVFIASIVTGTGWTLIDRNDLLYKAGFTSRVSQAHIWTKIFRTNLKDENWQAAVKVDLKNSKSYIGWPRYYSEQQEQNNIVFLSPAYTLCPSGKCKKLNGPGVLLFEREMSYIEFHKIPKAADHPCELSQQFENKAKP